MKCNDRGRQGIYSKEKSACELLHCAMYLVGGYVIIRALRKPMYSAPSSDACILCQG